LKEGVFFGRQTTKYQDFSKKLYSTERRAWKVFENVCRNFLGIENTENYSEILQQIISSHSAVGLTCH
jgi:hypothetical protein